jgi:hypothetical protein
MTDTTYHVTFFAYLDAVEAFIMISTGSREATRPVLVPYRSGRS